MDPEDLQPKAQVVPLRVAPDPAAAERRIKDLWENGLFFYIPHAVSQLDQRQLDATDVQNVIRCGKVVEVKRSNIPEVPWRCVVEGNSLEGEPLICILDINGRMDVVTAYPKSKKRTSKGV